MNEGDTGKAELKVVFNRLESFIGEDDVREHNKDSKELSPRFYEEYTTFLIESYIREGLEVYSDAHDRITHFDSSRLTADSPHVAEYKAKMTEDERAAWLNARNGSLEDYTWADTMRQMIFDAIQKAPQEMQRMLFRRLVSLVSQYGLGEDAEEMSEMIGLFVASQENHALQIDGYVSIIEAVCDHVSHPEAFTYREYEDQDTFDEDEELYHQIDDDGSELRERSIDDFAEVFIDELTLFSFHREHLIEALCTIDTEDMYTFLREFSSLPRYYAEFLGIIRTLIIRTPNSPLRDRLEHLGKLLIGFKENDPRPFHTLLSDVYEAVDFSEYEGYRSTEKTDVRLITDLAQEAGEGTIVDLGCGTGRLMHQLAQSPHVIKAGTRIIGVDIDEPSIATAQQAGEALQLDRVESTQGSFLEIADVLEPQSVSALYALGRTVSHVDGPQEFIRLIHNVHTVLKDGGVWLFDTPHPERGKIKEHREMIGRIQESFRQALSAYENTEKGAAFQVDYVVDSPDGVNFYSRYVPQIQAFLSQLRMCGFDAEVVTTSPLHGPSYNEDDESVYIRAVKQEGTTPLMRQQEPRTIAQMLSELSKGGGSQPQ